MVRGAGVEERGAEAWVRPGETLDDLRAGGLQIIQAEAGYRFSLDPILLCGFARVGAGERVADLGTGSGVIPLLLARRTAACRLVGVEIQASLADRARRSVTLNGLEERVEIIEGDVRLIRGLLPEGSFDAVLSNPPFRKPSAGRRAPEPERAAARHELAGGVDDFLAAGAFLLRPRGRIFLIFLAERLAELMEAMRRHRLEPKRLRSVHSRQEEPGRMVLVEGSKGGRPGMTVDPPLFIYDPEGYSPEVLSFYAP